MAREGVAAGTPSGRMRDVPPASANTLLGTILPSHPTPSLALSFPPLPRPPPILGAWTRFRPPASPCPCPLPRPPAPAPGSGSPAMAATRAMHRRRAWGSRPETRGGARCTGGRAGGGGGPWSSSLVHHPYLRAGIALSPRPGSHGVESIFRV